MRITGPVAPTNPFHLARAYGVGPARAPKAPTPQEVAPGASRLVAAVVPGRVSFEGAAPTPDRGTLELYRRPADRNIAATGVGLGRIIDVNG